MLQRRYRIHERGRPIVPEPFAVPPQEVDHKPHGLWFTPGPLDWADWCWDNAPSWMENAALGWFRLDLSRILVLDTAAKLLEFTDRYQEPNPLYHTLPSCSRLRSINWKRVAADYGGIEIAPYSWELRLDPRCHWYYTWDVASGCVWDRNAIHL